MLYNDPFKIYVSPEAKREFRVIFFEKVPNTDKWIGRTLKNHWKAVVKMLDNGQLIEIITGYNDEILIKRKYICTED